MASAGHRGQLRISSERRSSRRLGCTVDRPAVWSRSVPTCARIGCIGRGRAILRRQRWQRREQTGGKICGAADRRPAVAWRERLRGALDEGRLSLGEYDDRLKETYAARTYGDLDVILTDLPGLRPGRSSCRASRRRAATRRAPDESGACVRAAKRAARAAAALARWASAAAGSIAVTWPTWVIWAVVQRLRTATPVYVWPDVGRGAGRRGARWPTPASADLAGGTGRRAGVRSGSAPPGSPAMALTRPIWCDAFTARRLARSAHSVHSGMPTLRFGGQPEPRLARDLIPSEAREKDVASRQ